MDPRVAELLVAAKDVTSLARRMLIAGGTDAEFADIRLEKATRAIAAFDAPPPDGGRMTTQAIGEPE